VHWQSFSPLELFGGGAADGRRNSPILERSKRGGWFSEPVDRISPVRAPDLPAYLMTHTNFDGQDALYRMPTTESRNFFTRGR